MNFLAHIHLSFPDPYLMCGNFVADRMDIRDKNKVDKRIKRGIDLHLFIDRFTDQALINKSGLKLLYPRHSKYAPVLIDIYYDYLLCKNWYAFSDLSLELFSYQVYDGFRSILDELNLSIRPLVEQLINHQWLERAFDSYEGLDHTFYYLKKQVSEPSLIDGATQTLMDNEEKLNEIFLSFYPNLVRQTVIWKSMN